jgi:hypothetical protein
MATILAWLSVVLVPLYMASLLGGPMFLMGWLRRRREETIRRQIALTDAIDGHFGALASPVVTVKRPLWGPWKILIAVPFTRPAAVGRILALAHEVLSVSERMHPDLYEIVLTPKHETVRTESPLLLDQPAERWPRDTRVVA